MVTAKILVMSHCFHLNVTSPISRVGILHSVSWKEAGPGTATDIIQGRGDPGPLPVQPSARRELLLLTACRLAWLWLDVSAGRTEELGRAWGRRGQSS